MAPTGTACCAFVAALSQPHVALRPAAELKGPHYGMERARLSAITAELITIIQNAIVASTISPFNVDVTGSMPETVRKEGHCQLSLYCCTSAAIPIGATRRATTHARSRIRSRR